MSKKKKTFLDLLRKQKIRKPIIDAFDRINQAKFFDSVFKKILYTENTIPIGCSESSDPLLTLASMINHLRPKKKWSILEIGTGSGYSTALLSSMVKNVVTVEYHEELARMAKQRLEKLKIQNVRFFTGDATELNESLGLFDAVIVFASCQKRPISLLQNLDIKGKLVFPMGPAHQQQITVLQNSDESSELFHTEFFEFCTFTPIRGKYGIF
jgi:protein-L-isoaspartate(D-aspartate) O-methyltransferase